MFKLSVLAAAIAALVVPQTLAAAVDHHVLSKRVTSNLQKRDARMTWYDITTGETACGAWYSNEWVLSYEKHRDEVADKLVFVQ